MSASRLPRWTIAACVPLLAASCQAVRAAEDGAGPLTVVLFDVSRSTDDPDVRAGYLATFERVLDHAVAEGFMRADHRRLLLAETGAAALLDACAVYRPIPVPRWMGPAAT